MHSRALLHAVADHAADHLEGLDDAPVRAEVTDVHALRAALDTPLPAGPPDPARGRRGADRAAGPASCATSRRATSASSSAARCPPRWPPTGWPRPGTRTPASTSPRRPRPWSRRSPAAGCSSCSGCRRGVVRASSPAARWPTSPAWPRRATHVLRGAGWDVERARAGRRAADPRGRRRGAPRHDRPRACAPRPGHAAASSASPPTPRAACDADALRAALAAGDGPAIVCAQAGNVNTRRLRPARRDLRRGRRARAPGCTSTAPSACGPRPARAARTLRRRRRARRLVGDRRAQVAQRALRLRRRHRRAPRAAPRARWSRQRRLPEPHAGGERDAMRLDAGVLPPRARRSPSTRPCARSGRAGVAELVERCCAARGGSPSAWRAGAASRCSTTSSSTRCSCASATTTRDRRVRRRRPGARAPAG